ncbi:unnamed protein product [Ectocarpus sp. 12 AP-2014]
MTLDVLSATPHTTKVSGDARLAHDGWVSEFEAFQWSKGQRNEGMPHAGGVPMSARSGHSGPTTVARGMPSATGDGNATKAMDNLRAEIKLLHWHKLANEAALKAALLKTKKIKARGGGTSRPVPAMTTLSMPTDERAAWMQQVIEEEQSKPLQVSKDFMCKYEKQEEETEGRLDTEVAAHIRSLRNLRHQIEKRGEMKARRVKYRAAQKQLEREKQQLLLGKLHTTEIGGLASARRDPREGFGAGGTAGAGHGPPKRVGALDTVLGSLDKLVELEKRISSLEKSNVYDDFRATNQGGAGSTAEDISRSVGQRRSSVRAGHGDVPHRRSNVGRPGVGSRNRRLSFSKQTTEATVDTPSQTYYSVRVRRKPEKIVENSVHQKRRTRANMGNTSGVGLRARARASSSRVGGGGESTFLTQLPDVHRHPRAVAGRQGGGGGFRSAIGEKKRIEAKRKLAEERTEAIRIARQDRIIREWMQRKKAAAAGGSHRRKSSTLSRRGGALAAGGQKTRNEGGGASTNRGREGNNTHLQEFRDIRAHYARRTERLRRDLSRKGPERRAFLAGTRTVTVATRPRAAPVVSLPRFRPARISSTYVGQQRERRDSTPFEGTMRRDQTSMGEGRGGGIRRVSQGLAVGGTGLRAARACGTRKRTRSRPQRTSAVAIRGA